MFTIQARGATAAGSTSRRVATGFLSAFALLALALTLSASAGATTYPVSGKQIVIDEEKGEFAMKGGLIGDWTITSFKTLATSPLYRAKGTEKFEGCLDLKHDGRCSGDPAGSLSFRFLYWGLFGPGDSLVWGSCWHPVSGGSGDFKGARGVLVMADTPTAGGVATRYTGNVTIGSSPAARASSGPLPHCG